MATSLQRGGSGYGVSAFLGFTWRSVAYSASYERKLLAARASVVQREVSLKRGADGSWEHDRDISHRTDSHVRRPPRPSSREAKWRTSPSNDRREAYAFIERTLVRFRYHFGLSRIGKGVVRRFLARVTGYSPAQADPSHRAPAPHGRDPGPQATPSGPAFPNRLHARRRRAAGGGGRGLRPALRPGNQGGPAAPARGLQGQALRAPGGDIGTCSTAAVHHEDLAPNHFQIHDRERKAKHLLRHLRKLGLEVDVREAA